MLFVADQAIKEVLSWSHNVFAKPSSLLHWSPKWIPTALPSNILFKIRSPNLGTIFHTQIETNSIMYSYFNSIPIIFSVLFFILALKVIPLFSWIAESTWWAQTSEAMALDRQWSMWSQLYWSFLHYWHATRLSCVFLWHFQVKEFSRHQFYYLCIFNLPCWLSLFALFYVFVHPSR